MTHVLFTHILSLILITAGAMRLGYSVSEDGASWTGALMLVVGILFMFSI